MKLDAGKFAMATATVGAVAGLLCGVIYKIAPEAYLSAAALLTHSEMVRTARTFGWGEILIAVAIWWVLIAAVTYSVAMVYNAALGTRPPALKA